MYDTENITFMEYTFKNFINDKYRYHVSILQSGATKMSFN